LNRDALKGARIGVLSDVFGRESVHQEVNAVTEDAIARMASAGATIVRITIPGLDGLTRNIQVADFEAKAAFNHYLAALGPRAPVKTFDEFVARGEFHPSLKSSLEAERRTADRLDDSEYKNRLLRRQELRQAVMSVMAANSLDAILYPHQRRLVVPIGEEQVERNGVLSNSTGFPAITFPGGFSRASASAPIGVPIGIELLGPDWSEPRLIGLAFAFEQMAKLRRPPASTPGLER
jgi:Asp-tRNA(Asn)/Glu-tRNA(Gln) amidotransferase A subunit family amidase